MKMESGSDYTLFNEVSDSYTDLNSGENIALKTISSNKRNSDSTSVISDINGITKCSSFVNSMWKRLCKSILLFCTTLLVIAVMQIPITLFYTDPASEDIEICNIADFGSCQVIYIYTCAFI